MKTIRPVIPGLAGFLLTSAIASAQVADVAGSKDHPRIARYPGAYIIGYDARGFEELTLVLGPTVPVEGRSPLRSSKSQRVEGSLTRILYVAPEDRSSLEVFRNYEAALKKAGFQLLFSCAGGECDTGGNVERFRDLVYPQGKTLENRGQLSHFAFHAPKDLRYLAAHLSAPGMEMYVSLMVAVETWRVATLMESFNHPLALLEVVEAKPMDAGMITVNAESMSRDIAGSGHVALYGIHFDTGSDLIKPESEPLLAEIAKLLQQQPALRLYVVGHTDKDGSYDYNMDLSNRRANSVVGHLGTRYSVEAVRLRAVGVGFLAPVASNNSEEGRARNRRVELVEQ